MTCVCLTCVKQSRGLLASSGAAVWHMLHVATAGAGRHRALTCRACRHARRWKVLVDAAAYVPTQPLDLSAVRPDFVAMSFYKMFGYPTGLGALLVRVDAAEVLNKVRRGAGGLRWGLRWCVPGPSALLALLHPVLLHGHVTVAKPAVLWQLLQGSLHGVLMAAAPSCAGVLGRRHRGPGHLQRSLSRAQVQAQRQAGGWHSILP